MKVFGVTVEDGFGDNSHTIAVFSVRAQAEKLADKVPYATVEEFDYDPVITYPAEGNKRWVMTVAFDGTIQQCVAYAGVLDETFRPLQTEARVYPTYMYVSCLASSEEEARAHAAQEYGRHAEECQRREAAERKAFDRCE